MKKYGIHILIHILMGSGLINISLAQYLSPEEQDFLEAVSLNYQQAGSYLMEIWVSNYDEKGQKIGQSQRHFTAKTANRFHIQTPYLTRVIGDGFQLMVNPVDRFIRLDSLDKAQMARIATEQQRFDFSSSLFASNENVRMEKTDSTLILKLLPNTHHPVMTHYRFNQQEFTLRGVDYYYPESDPGQIRRIEIRYTQVSLNEDLPDSLFSWDRFLQHNGNTLSPLPSYADFTFINHFNL